MPKYASNSDSANVHDLRLFRNKLEETFFKNMKKFSKRSYAQANELFLHIHVKVFIIIVSIQSFYRYYNDSKV